MKQLLRIITIAYIVGPTVIHTLCDNAKNFMNGNLTICGDLTVEGTINNVVQNFNVDNGSTVSPLAGTIQLSGIVGSGFVPSGIETHNGGGLGNDIFIENRRWATKYMVDPSSTVGDRGTFTTIQDAIDAAVLGGIATEIYIRPGTYNENLTLHPFIYLTGLTVDGRIGSVMVEGNHTFAPSLPTALCAIENISFSSSSGDTFTIAPSSGTCILGIKFCNIANSNGIAFRFTPSDTAFAIAGTTQSQINTSSHCAILNKSSNLNLTMTAADSQNGDSLFLINDTSGTQVISCQLSSQGDIFDIRSSSDSNQCLFCTAVSSGALARFVTPYGATPGALTVAQSIVVASDPSGEYLIGDGNVQYVDLGIIGSAKNIDPNIVAMPRDWQPHATAGTTSTAIRGTAGFDENQFTVSNGFVALSTPPNFFSSYVDVAAYTDSYTVTEDDSYISVDTSAGPVAITLPTTPASLITFTVKDRTGNANANPITIDASGTLIDGATSVLLNTNYGALQFMFNGTAYEIF